jgi:hypothetical protein
MVSRQTGIGGRTAQVLGWRRKSLAAAVLSMRSLVSLHADWRLRLVLTLPVVVVPACFLRVQAESPNNPSASPLSSGPAAPNVGEAQSAQDLTLFVQNLLQQMQTRFQTMSNAIIGRSQCKYTRDWSSGASWMRRCCRAGARNESLFR